MEWETFLEHPKVINSDINIPPGKYLFGKVLHDLLDCLTSFNRLVDMAASLPSLPSDAQNWLSSWSPIFEGWIKSMQPLWKYYEEETNNNTFLDTLLKISNTLSDVHLPSLEAKALTLPEERVSKYIVESAIRNVVRLNLIYNDLLNKEYLRIWETDYKDFNRQNS